MKNHEKPKSVAVLIPARGGSKGVPNKNLRPLNNIPLLGHSIEAALCAPSVTSVIVSSEDSEILRYARSLKAEAFAHPPELSKNDAPSFPVVQWDLSELKRRNRNPDVVVVLRATAPLRTSEDIDAAIRLLLLNEHADSVASVVPVTGIDLVKLKEIRNDGSLTDAYEPEGRYPKRRQELKSLYIRNESIYVVLPSVIESGGLWGEFCLPYVMPEERSININTTFQFQLAELVMHDIHRRGRM